MVKIDWCKEQSRGIKLVDPNDNLSEEYFRTAENTLRFLKRAYDTHDNMWLATTKYYAEYFAVYSVMIKIGIKCEIHDCTITIVKLLEDEGLFKKGTFDMLEEDKELRIDNQYYLKNRQVDIDFDVISGFLLEIKEINDSLNQEKIEKLREII